MYWRSDRAEGSTINRSNGHGRRLSGLDAKKCDNFWGSFQRMGWEADSRTHPGDVPRAVGGESLYFSYQKKPP